MVRGLPLLLGGMLLMRAALSGACVEDVENTPTAWSMAGLWHVSNSSCLGAHSGAQAFYFGLEGQCNYDDRQVKDASLVSPLVTITGVGDTNFSFWTKWQVESMNPSCYDQLWVERYDPSSGAWSSFAEVGPVSDPPTSAPGAGVASVTGFGGDPQWQFVQLDLSAFAGSSLRMRFRFASSACLAPLCGGKTCGPPDADFDGFSGWAIDDISLGCNPSNLILMKSAAPSYASHNDTVTYTISAKNTAASPATLSLWDTLPAGAVFLGGSGAPSLVGSLVSWSLPSLAPQASQSVTLILAVDPSLPYPADWWNTASGSSSAGGADFQSAVAPVKIRDNVVAISKSVKPATATSGDQVTFSISLSNFTAAAISQVDLVETYPPGFVELGAYPAYATARTWHALGLLPGETRIYTVWGFANGFNGQAMVNRAEAFVSGVSQGSATASVTLMRPEVPQLRIAAVYPNPAPSGKPGLPQSAFVVYDCNLSMQLNLDIFSVAGEKLRSLSLRSVRGRGQAEWDLKNDSGAGVASGIYLARLWQNVSRQGLVEAWAQIAVLR